MKKKLLALLLSLSLLLAMASCSNDQNTDIQTSADTSAQTSETGTVDTSTADNEGDTDSQTQALPEQDLSGNDITVPENADKIVCLAPATAQILEALGLTGNLIAVDSYTPIYIPETEDLPQYDMMSPDCESLAALEPDIVFTTGMSSSGGDDVYASLRDTGVCVADMPTPDSIDGIKEDIMFVAQCVGMADEGQALVDEMQNKIDEIADIGSAITDKKTVMFEIAALPSIYSFGTGVFLNEMLDIIGAQNVFSDQEGWIAVTEESALAADPDVILTSVDYIEDPVTEITSRDGWDAVTAVKNGDVYYIDTASSNLANQNIVKALAEMAKAVYPDAYSSVEE